MSQLQSRLARIEAKIKAKPGGNVSLWLAGLLQSPEENQIMLNAASFLMLEGILDTPEPHIWERLAARMNSDCTTWPQSQLWFAVAQQELESADFDDDGGKEILCLIARGYFEVFQEMPLPQDERQRERREEELDRLFLRPMMGRACPEMEDASSEARWAWLQMMLDSPKEPDSPLASLREYEQQIHKPQEAQ